MICCAESTPRPGTSASDLCQRTVKASGENCAHEGTIYPEGYPPNEEVLP
jgi:hypothetical protein